ncbi:MAG TPA: fumarylacetoacetate hydrolase family protein [Cytophagaceae bacterium]|jgi:2-keto-4-pentenoate hydratase/2-oxohepta-3-ene-1,7-dioic acid hydratase in catechol pathway
MKLLYFLENNILTLGISTPKGVIKMEDYSHSNLSNADVKEIQKKVKEYNGEYLEEANLRIASSSPRPSKIICIGLNYRKHAIESNMAIPTIPVVFTKYNNTLINYGDNVSLGKVGEQFDYEVELGVVIGEKCKNVSKENALDYVLGYVVSNDMSCRDLQFRSSQWLMGKSLDTFLPLGKYTVTKDEVGDPQKLKLTCTLNGEERQNSNTEDMIFTVAEIIEDLSLHMTLEPGDLILTGTPAGVILGLPEKNWLKPGDVVTVEIEKLGKTTNTMVA